MKMWHNICFWYFEGSNLTDCKICKIMEGTFESRKEGRSKEEKGVMTSEK